MSKPGRVAGVAAPLLALLPLLVAGHAGHEHGAAETPPPLAVAPAVAAAASGRASAAVLSLPARVIADPRRTLVIAAPQAGAVIAPKRGFPAAGQWLRAGESLAELQPALPTTARRDIEAQLVDARRDADIGYLQIDRYGIEAQKFDVSLPTQTLQIVTDYRAAQVRRDQMQESLSGRLAITAPRAGRLLRLDAASGRQYAAGEPLFVVQLDDGLAVEARFIDAGLVAPEVATARLDDGSERMLHLLGRGYDAAQRVAVVRYALAGEAGAALAVNQRLRILLPQPSGSPR